MNLRFVSATALENEIFWQREREYTSPINSDVAASSTDQLVASTAFAPAARKAAAIVVTEPSLLSMPIAVSQADRHTRFGLIFSSYAS